MGDPLRVAHYFLSKKDKPMQILFFAGIKLIWEILRNTIVATSCIIWDAA